MFKTPLGDRNVCQQVSSFSHVNICKTRQGGTETTTGFLKCGTIECTLARQRQIMHQSTFVSEGAGLEEMVRDVTGTLVEAIRVELLNRIGDTDVQALLAWD